MTVTTTMILAVLSAIVLGGGAGAVLYRWFGKPRVDLKESELDARFKNFDIREAERMAKNNDYLIAKLVASDQLIAEKCVIQQTKIEERDCAIKEALKESNEKRKEFEISVTRKLDNIGRDVARTLVLSSATAKTTVTMADELASKGHVNSKTEKHIDELRGIIYKDVGDATT